MDLSDKRIVVTGGAGFLGRVICDTLRARGAEDAHIFVPLIDSYDLTHEDVCRRLYEEAFAGEPVDLTSGEFDLLMAFVERPNRVLSRDQLLDITKGREAMPFDRSIDVQLSRLRKKIEADHTNPRLIKTIRGGGYMFATKVEHE